MSLALIIKSINKRNLSSKNIIGFFSGISLFVFVLWPHQIVLRLWPHQIVLPLQSGISPVQAQEPYMDLGIEPSSV